MARLPEGAIPVEPPVGESQSNGAMENAVKLVKGMLRVHLSALERKTGARIPSKHPIMAWLVEHAGDVVTKYLQGSDGRTGFERLFGKQVHEEGLEYGERLLYKKRKENDYNVVVDSRWAPGLWLGRKWGASPTSLPRPVGSWRCGRCSAGQLPRGGVRRSCRKCARHLGAPSPRRKENPPWYSRTGRPRGSRRRSVHQLSISQNGCT